MASDNTSANKPLVIVLVEDEFLIRALMADVLIDAGFEVREAAHASEALDIVTANASEVSLVFTDIHMPGEMDGIALVHRLHKNWPGIGLLITSGRARLMQPICRRAVTSYPSHMIGRQRWNASAH